MGILSRKAIEGLLKAEDLLIDPAPKVDHFESDSVEVHLGDVVYTWQRQSSGATVSVALWKTAETHNSERFDYKGFSELHLRTVPPDTDGIITMRPHTFYLADLMQYTKLPPDVAMHIQGKSSLARLGVQIHLTAPHAHAGWEGRLTLEMYNSGPFNIELKPGVPVGQLTFWRVEDPQTADAIRRGQFAEQQSASGAKTPPTTTK